MAPSSDMDFSTVDFYELLAIPQSSNESEIRRAYRKQSRLYHPDKVTPTPETLDKFQLLQHAIEILTDATARSKYDANREAKQRRAAESRAMEDRRRKMKEDLESREAGAPSSLSTASSNGVKRTWTDRELEIKRIAEENSRKMEAARSRKLEELRKMEEAAREEQEPTDTMERSVKVRWIKEGDGLDIDDEALTEMFPVGEVENVVILKDKKRKIEGRDRKIVLGTAVLVFKNISAAKRVVAKGRTGELESVEWALENKDNKPA